MSLDERNAVLDQKIQETDLPSAVDTLIKDAKQRKRQIRLLFISILLDLFLTVGLGVVSVTTRDIAGKAESNQQAILRTCQSNNASRANNKQLWTYLLSQPPSEPVAPDKQIKIDQFKAYVDKTFAPRDCNSVIE